MNIKVSDHYYFMYSAIYVTFRIMSMLYFGGSVNDASKKMLNILRNAPTQNWCDDVSGLRNLLRKLIMIIFSV